MMKKGFRLVALCLALLLLMTAAACNGGTTEGTDDITVTTAAPAPSSDAGAPTGNDANGGESDAMYPLAETVVLTLWNTVSPDVTNNIETMNNHIIMKEAAERTNIQLEITDISITSARDNFGIMVASQDYTDIIKAAVGHYTTNGLSGALANELIIDMAEYLPEYAPDYWSLLSANETNLRNAKTDGGNILAFFTVRDNIAADFDGPTIRYDLLEELGMDSPETYDDYYNVLTAFKTEYDMTDPIWFNWTPPDGSGINSDNAAFLIGGYNVGWAFYQVDGTIKYGPMEDGFREYIEMLNKWYDEGLIYSDFYSRPTNTLDAENQAIILNGQQGVAFLSGNDITGVPTRQVTGNSNYRLTAIKDPSKDGTPHHMGNVPQVVASTVICLTVTTACENIDAAVMWGNYWYTEAGSTLLNYGIEGVTFEYDSNGNPQFTELLTNNPNELTFNIARQAYLVYTQIPGLRNMRNEQGNQNADAKAASDIWLSSYDNAWILPGALSYTEEESSELSALKADIATYNSEAVLAFIIGTKEITDETWSEYQNTIISMDIERCKEIYQGALDRYYLR